MKKTIFATAGHMAALTFGFFVVVLLGSCVTSPYKPFSELTDAEIIGSVQIEFWGGFIVSRENTYTKLLEEAQKEYQDQGTLDVCDITIAAIVEDSSPASVTITGRTELRYTAKGSVVRIGGTDVQVAQAPAVSQLVVADGPVADGPVTPPDEDFVIVQNRDGETVTITGYKGSARNIIIPKTLYGLPVIAIANEAFLSKGLTNVVIPGSVITIGVWAFALNPLTDLTLEDGITTIGSRAFSGSNANIINGSLEVSPRHNGPRNKLTSITIPDSVVTIGDSAFNSNQLTSLTLGNGITTIGDGVFSNNQLTNVIIPDSVTTIGNGAFSGNKLTSLTLGNGITFIGVNAFENNQLTSLTIPGSVTTIRGGAFRGNKLTSLIIPDSVTTIGGAVNRYSVDGSTGIGGSGPGAFSNNQLTSIILGRGLNVIHRDTFSGNQLTRITIAKDVPARSVSAVIDYFDNSITAPGIGTDAGFEQNFINFYESQGRSPGTYVKNGPIWQKQ
jgi:hypothetical protein